jgi:hypothetical protein
MTLILSARCRDGCVALADRRCRKTSNGLLTYEDNWEKLHMVRGAILFNHGRNLIAGRPWHERKLELTPDESNPLYSQVSHELLTKISKKAFFVFLTKRRALEIKVEAGQTPRLKDLTGQSFLLSGNGKRHVDCSKLQGVRSLRCREALKLFAEVFGEAYQRQLEVQDDQFSHDFTTLTKKG